jgi:hypothetical protein
MEKKNECEVSLGIDSDTWFAIVPNLEGKQHDEQLALHWAFSYISTIDFMPVEHDKHKTHISYRNFCVWICGYVLWWGVHVHPQASEDNNVWLRAGALLVFVSR